MVDILESNRSAIAEACTQHGVKRLDVFGSALRADFEVGQSDLDLLVEFTPLEGYARVDAYFGLLNELRRILDREVDLVISGAVQNRYIFKDIEQTKQMLYAA